MLRASSGYNVSEPVPRPANRLLTERAGWAAQGLVLGLAAALLAWPAASYVIKHHRAASKPAPVAVAKTPTPRPAAPVLPPGVADFGQAKASPQARQLAQWVMAGHDHGGHPFAILDKRQARVFVFRPDGKLAGATPVLLGYAAGDDSVAGIGLKPIADVRPSERTTPAGRFVAQPGRNTLNEDVLWVDYDAAVSMHRVRNNNPAERRLERLATPSPKDNRISFGCINMPVKFFEQQLWPAFGKKGGIVYVLPERKPLEQVFSRQAEKARGLST